MSLENILSPKAKNSNHQRKANNEQRKKISKRKICRAPVFGFLSFFSLFSSLKEKNKCVKFPENLNTLNILKTIPLKPYQYKLLLLELKFLNGHL